MIIVDQSSSAGSAKRRCREVLARVQQLMKRAPFEVVVIGTGSNQTGNEPVVLVDRRSWTGVSRALFKDPGAQKKKRDDWMASLEAACVVNFRSSDTSPILRSLERGLETLRARATEMTRKTKPFTLQLFVHSDMSEGVDRAFLAHLSKRRRKLPKLPNLNLDGVELAVCLGTHNRDGNGDLMKVHALWRQVFGTDVPFDLVCPMPEGGTR